MIAFPKTKNIYIISDDITPNGWYNITFLHDIIEITLLFMLHNNYQQV